MTERTAEWNGKIAIGLRRFWSVLSPEEKRERLTKSFLSPSSRDNMARTKGHSPIPDFANVSEEDKQWLVGFWEGDGSCSIVDSRLNIMFYQRNPQVLKFIQDLVNGGSLSFAPTSNGPLYLLGFYGWERSSPVLKVLSQYLVNNYRVEQLNRLLSGSSVVPRLVEHSPTLPWACGFFDAEGGIYFCASTKELSAIFTQVRGREVLEKLQVLIGGRLRLAGGKLYLRIEEIRRFLPFYFTYSRDEPKKGVVLNNLLRVASVNRPWRCYVEGQPLLRRYLP